MASGSLNSFHARLSQAIVPGRASWAFLVLSAVIVAILLAIGPTYLVIRDLVPQLLIAAVFFALYLVVLCRIGPDTEIGKRVASILAGMAFLILSWNVIRLLNHTTMALAFPLADDWLSQADEMLRLDWAAYFEAVRHDDMVRTALAKAYTSLTPLSVIAYLLIAVLSDIRRSVYFLETFTSTAVFCTISGAFVPGYGAADRYIDKADMLAEFKGKPGVFFLDHLDALRSGEPVHLVLDSLPGLVTFPSFHTAAGVVLLIATWRSLAFIPALAYVLVMIAATPIYGGHYFVDLIAGVIVAATVCWFWARQPKYAGLFS